MDFDQIIQTVTTIGRTPHSSPVKGEETNKLTAISSLFVQRYGAARSGLGCAGCGW